MKEQVIFSDSSRERVKKVVEEVEKTTSGEIVPAIVYQSDPYAGAAWRIAFAVSLILTYVFYYFVDYLPFAYYIVLEILLIPVGFVIARIPFLFRLAITKRELDEEVFQRALEMFHSQGLANTRDRTGILIFISKLERRVIILADAGINEKVSKDFWREIVNEMVLKIKKGQIADALCDAIRTSGVQLSTHFPIKADDTNELSNDVVVE